MEFFWYFGSLGFLGSLRGGAPQEFQRGVWRYGETLPPGMQEGSVGGRTPRNYRRGLGGRSPPSFGSVSVRYLSGFLLVNLIFLGFGRFGENSYFYLGILDQKQYSLLDTIYNYMFILNLQEHIYT